jgi:nicotinamidase-related amidase
MPLLDRSDSVLIVVDTQPGFYPPGRAIDRRRFALVRERVAWLAGVARALGVPAVVTEEDRARNGGTDPAVLARLPEDSPILAKPVFGLADCDEILAAVAATGRRTAILAGLETDVCVTHSAVGLHDRGYRVAVVADATFAPGEMHELGLRRMTGLGVELVHAKGIYYEWARSLEVTRRFEAENPDLAEPPGFSL